MDDHLIVVSTRDPQRVRLGDGTIQSPPTGWEFLPAGDAGLTRRVKAAGPVWVVQEKRGRKIMTRGIWAAAAVISQARAALEQERADPRYERRLTAGRQRRERLQSQYVDEFREAVSAFLRFASPFRELEHQLADAVATLATPVGSGTVARTQRIRIEERAEAAVVAWLRHQTTAYDRMRIARVKGRRRQVRRELAELSRAMLDQHRQPELHPSEGCPLCAVLNSPPQGGSNPPGLNG